MLDRLRAAISPAKLLVRGGFHPNAEDNVPPLPDGAPTRTVVLIGNAGGDMWHAFDAAPRDPNEKNPLEAWLRPQILDAARALEAHAIFPNDGPPFVPIQQWGARAEPIHRSPIGIMIHPDYGLWHVYRAALLFKQRLDLPPRKDQPSPCDSCNDKPCLKVCPADAFEPTRFKIKECVTHVVSEQGANCRERGCLARRACPIGRDYVYPRPQQAFHTAAFVRAAKRQIA